MLHRRRRPGRYNHFPSCTSHTQPSQWHHGYWCCCSRCCHTYVIRSTSWRQRQRVESDYVGSWCKHFALVKNYTQPEKRINDVAATSNRTLRLQTLLQKTYILRKAPKKVKSNVFGFWKKETLYHHLLPIITCSLGLQAWKPRWPPLISFVVLRTIIKAICTLILIYVML